MVVGLQLLIILFSRGNVYLLGEAYAFGVIWSFVFNSLAMLVLRFKYQGERGWKVPPNLRIGNTEIPIGLASVCSGADLGGHREPVHQVGCHRERRSVYRGFFHGVHGQREGQPAQVRGGRPPDARAVSAIHRDTVRQESVGVRPGKFWWRCATTTPCTT